MMFSLNHIRCSGLVLCIVLLFSSHVNSQQAQQKLSNEIVASESSSSGSNPVKNSSSGSANNFAVHLPATGSGGSFGGSGGNYREYGSAYYYPAPHHKRVIWNRDSYADAANDFGYNPATQHESHGSTHSFVPNTEYGVAEGHEEEGGGLGGSLGGLGGLGGLAGVLGIKGIKGLGILALLKAGLPLLALLLPALLLLPLVFLFLPVPVITIPSNPNGRELHPGLRFGDISARMTQLARSVLNSEKCVERMSCELSKVSQGTFVDKALKRVFSKFEKHLPPPIQRMARAYMEQSTSHCNKKYACYLVDDNAISKSS